MNNSVTQNGLIDFRALGLLLLLCATAAIGLWIGERLTSPVKEGGVVEGHRPDYTMEHFTITSMDTSGQPRYYFKAESMLHYPDTSETEVSKPHIEIFESGKQPWHLQSLKGQYSEQLREVTLTGDVRLERKAGKNNRGIDLQTQSMKIYPDTQEIRAEQHVIVRSNGSSIEAIGMIADLKKETIQLLSKVRGTYVTPKK